MDPSQAVLLAAIEEGSKVAGPEKFARLLVAVKEAIEYRDKYAPHTPIVELLRKWAIEDKQVEWRRLFDGLIWQTEVELGLEAIRAREK